MTNSLTRKPWKSVLVFVILTVITVFAVLATILWIKLPHDDIRKGITMDQAQSLVSFPICTPTVIPQGVDPDPEIIYDSDAASVPEETYIRLRYMSTDGQKLVIEVYQVYTPNEGMKPAFSVSRVEGAEVILLYWMFPRISESRLDVAREQTQVESNVSQTDGTVWWLYEIVDPSEYRSTLTEWTSNHVEYRVLSYLPAEAIREITLSIIKCSNRS